MTCENNKKGCNNKILINTLMLVSMVCMLSVSDMLGMEKPPEQPIYNFNQPNTQPLQQPIYVPRPDIRNVLQPDVIYEVLGKNKEFKKFIDGINTKGGEYRIEYTRYCYCCRGNVLNAAVCDQNGVAQNKLIEFIYDALEVHENKHIQLKNNVEGPLDQTGIYKYMDDNKVVDQLNVAIENKVLKPINEMNGTEVSSHKEEEKKNEESV